MPVNASLFYKRKKRYFDVYGDYLPMHSLKGEQRNMGCVYILCVSDFVKVTGWRLSHSHATIHGTHYRSNGNVQSES